MTSSCALSCPGSVTAELLVAKKSVGLEASCVLHNAIEIVLFREVDALAGGREYVEVVSVEVLRARDWLSWRVLFDD